MNNELYEKWALSLMKEGVIVSLKIRKWNGSSILKFENLGISFVNEKVAKWAKSYLRISSKKVIPDKYLIEFDSICMAAYKNLRDYSYKTIWGHFVPYCCFLEWYEKNEEYRLSYLKVIEDFFLNYENVILDIKKIHKNMAIDVWSRLYPSEKDDPSPSFVEDFVCKIINGIPPRDKLIKKFSFNFLYSEISLPSMINIYEKNEISNEALLFVAKKHFENKRNYIQSFITSTISSLRKKIFEKCDYVFSSIKSKKDFPIHKKNINCIYNMINWFNKSDFYGDKKMKIIMNDLYHEINKLKEERSDFIIYKKLEEIICLCLSDLVFNEENFNIKGSFLNPE